MVTIDTSNGVAPAMPTSKSADTTDKLLYCRKESAKMLSMSIRMLDYWIACGVLAPVRRIGRRILIPAQTLHNFASTDHEVK